MRFEILDRDNFTCVYCGQFAPNVLLEVGHKVAMVDGGTNDEENLVTSCFACNRGKEALRRQRVKVTKKDIPVPVTTKRRVLAILDRPMTAEEISAISGVHSQTVKVVLNRERDAFRRSAPSSGGRGHRTVWERV